MSWMSIDSAVGLVGFTNLPDTVSMHMLTSSLGLTVRGFLCGVVVLSGLSSNPADKASNVFVFKEFLQRVVGVQ